MSVLLPDDLARDLGLLLETGWFVPALQKPQMKTGKMFLVNATKDPSWKLLLTYDPNDRTRVDPRVELYRNETEYTELDRAGLLRAIVQPEVIEGPWLTLPDDEDEYEELATPNWPEDAKARMLAALPGARLDEDDADGFCVIFVPVPGRPAEDAICIQRPDVGVDLPPIWLYQVDTGWDTRDEGKLALFIDDGDVVKYVKQVLAELAPVHSGWSVSFHRGRQNFREVGLETRESALDFCVRLTVNGEGEMRTLRRPDGSVELEGQELRTAMWAYEANRERNG